MRDITPSIFKCNLGLCPAVYELDSGQVLIIGKKPSALLNKQIETKVGEDEYAIIVDPRMLVNVKTNG